MTVGVYVRLHTISSESAMLTRPRESWPASSVANLRASRNMDRLGLDKSSFVSSTGKSLGVETGSRSVELLIKIMSLVFYLFIHLDI